jgi:hypothetical protein
VILTCAGYTLRGGAVQQRWGISRDASFETPLRGSSG